MKRCCTCKNSKALSEFTKNKSAKDGLSRQCKVCHNRTKKKYRDSHKLKIKDYNLKQYGIDLDKYNKMFQEQQGCCAICGKHQSELKKSFDVDHSHKNGKVRGLLCCSCNLQLGIFENRFDEFSEYLDFKGRQ